MYKQYDGYPEGLGIELQAFINSKTMVNGIGNNQQVFNGINCFAAQLVEHFKDGPGGIYLYAPTPRYESNNYSKKYGVDYYYIIDNNLNLKCYNAYTNELESIPIK